MNDEDPPLDDATLQNSKQGVSVDRSEQPLYVPGATDVEFELVDDEEEPTEFEVVETTTPVELVRAPSDELVPYEAETSFELVEQERPVTEFELVEDDTSPSLVPAGRSALRRHNAGEPSEPS